MVLSYLCVLIAAILPYVWVGYAKFSSPSYNNSAPREFLDRLEGKARRANYAQMNAFEAFPAFAAAVIVAHLRGVAPSTIDLLAVLFVLFRTAHGLCYIAGNASVRSLVWFAGFICVISLFVLSLRSAA